MKTPLIYNKIAEFYNLIFQLQHERANTKEECNFLENVFTKLGINPKLILDLGCGGGRMTCELSKRKYSVAGIDASPKMIKLARKNCPKAHFLESQMESFPMDADVAIIWWTTYTYINLKELKALIEKLYEKVNFVVLDSSNYPADQRPSHTIKKLKKGGVLIEEERKWSIKGKTRFLYYTYKVNKGNAKKVIKYKDISYWYPIKELEGLFNRKFDLIRSFGDYNVNRAYKEDNSKRMITVWKNTKL